MGDDQAGVGLSLRDLLGLGSYTVVCVLAGMGLGWWADSSSGSTPVYTLVGLLAGVAVGVLGTWVRVRPFLRDGAAGDQGTGDNDRRA